MPPAAMEPLLQSPEKPDGYVMPVTLSGELPVLAMVRTAACVPPAGVLPRSKDVGTLMMRAAPAVPVPLVEMVLVPLVRSEFTVMVPP